MGPSEVLARCPVCPLPHEGSEGQSGHAGDLEGGLSEAVYPQGLLHGVSGAAVVPAALAGVRYRHWANVESALLYILEPVCEGPMGGVPHTHLTSVGVTPFAGILRRQNSFSSSAYM